MKSTSLRAAGYQELSALLELEFRTGAIYHYFGVPPLTFHELLQAESKGGYFNHHIRNRFPTIKIQLPRSTATL
jgi:hypothetical protein